MTDSTGHGGRVAAAIRRRPLLLLFLICFAAWVPGLFTLPPLDRDESRFAQASKQMLETKNFVDIRFGVEPRYKKPVGIYWLQAASAGAISAATGDTKRNQIWTYRIPSLVGAFAAVALTFWCATAFLEVEAAFLAALLLGLTLLLSSEAKIAKTDAVLLATVVGAQAVLFKAYLARDPDRPPLALRTALLGWTAFAVGILIKGPVVFAVCGATALVLVLWDSTWPWMGRALLATVLASLGASLVFKDVIVVLVPWAVMLALAGLYGDWRWLGQLRLVRGPLLALFLVLPWLLAIWFASHGAFYSQALGHDFGAKLAGGQEGHGMPPGFYLLTSIGALWPTTLFVPLAIAWAATRHREPAIRFLIAWAGATWLLFELVPTKLPNYILPAYPAIAMLVAAFLVAPKPAPASDPETGAPIADGRRYLYWGSALYYLIGAGLIAAALTGLPYYFGVTVTWDFIAATSVVALLALAAAAAMLRESNGWALTLAASAAILAYAVFTLDDAPRLDALRLSPREADMMARHTQAGDPPPVLVGFTEPSLMFLIGTQTRLVRLGRDGAEISVAEGGGLAAVGDGQRAAFLAHLAELEADARPVDEIAGYAYSNGRPVHITLYRVTPPHEVTAPPQE